MFTIFVLFNFFVFLSSFGIIGIDIYFFVQIQEANGFTIGFLVLGGVLLIFSAMAFSMRRSIHLLGFYLVFLFLLFLFEFIITVVMIAEKEQIIVLAKKFVSDKTASEIQEFETYMSSSMNIVATVLFIFCGVSASTLLCGIFYRKSIQQRTSNAKDNLIRGYEEEERKEKYEEINQKNQEKRL